MYFLALAVDYDGTIAENGHVTPETTQALQILKQSGRKLLLVTGRELTELRHAYNNLDIFDLVVAENGAVLYDPVTKNEIALAPTPPIALLHKLSEYKVAPISVGRAIIATWHPHEQAVMKAILELGLEMQITFNKGAVMVLPTNVNKASGLQHALKQLDISPLNVVAVGDAENDHAFLSACGCSAAVANAVASLKQEVDVQLLQDHGSGVAALIERIIAEDQNIVPLSRRAILAGTDRQGEEAYIEAGDLILVVGNSGCGKSSLMTLLTERIAERGFEFCVIDPEGDYLGLEHAVTIGGVREPPTTEDAVRLLLQAGINVVVNTLTLNPADRKRLLADLTPYIDGLRKTSGRPHWLIIDEAHHMLPLAKQNGGMPVVARSGAILVTTDLQMIDKAVIKASQTVIAMGSTAHQLLATYAVSQGVGVPEDLPRIGNGEFILWSPASGRGPSVLRQERPYQGHYRHKGKYVTGDIGAGRSFYFRGPNLQLNLKASNLAEFLRLGNEVDDIVWDYHLHKGDYTAWFRNVIGDDVLAQETSDLEKDKSLSAQTSREKIAGAIAKRYHI